MHARIPIASCLLLVAFLQTDAGSQDTGLTPVPVGLVTVDVVKAKIDEAESDPGLDSDAKTKLVILYRKALTNLEQLEANRARARAFEETTRTAPEQTQQIRERISAAQATADAKTPPDLGVGPQMPLDRIEWQLNQEEADRAAANARRAELERALVYQETRPAAIRGRVTAAQEEQGAIAAALREEFAGGTGSAPMQARRWGLETRYVALSAELMALDQELIALPMHLDLTAAQRDFESANSDRIERRVEALRVLVNGRREDEARQAKAAAERMLRATAGLDPGLARLAEQNIALTAALAAIVEQSGQLDAEEQQVRRLAERTQANFEQARTASAVGVAIEGLGQLLLDHQTALPDSNAYRRRAQALEREIAALNLSRMRHLEETRGLAAEPATDSQPRLTPSAYDLRLELKAQRRSLLKKLLETEGRALDRLRKLQSTEAQMLEAARTYDAFLKEQLFWLPTGTRTRLVGLAELPQEVSRLLASGPWSGLAPILAGTVAASPALWLVMLVSAVLLWKRRALIAAIQATAAPLKNPSSDRFDYTLRALLLTLALAAPLPMALGVIGWTLASAGQGTALSPLLGAFLVRVALFLYVPLVLRAILLPGGLALAHFRWAEPDVRRLDFDLRWLIWVWVPADFVLRMAWALNPVEAGGLVTRLGVPIAMVAMALFFYRTLRPKQGLLRHQRLSAESGLLYRAYPLWFSLLVAFPLLLVALTWNGYVYTTVILADAFFMTLGMIVALILLRALAVRWLTLAQRRLAAAEALERRRETLAAREREGAQALELAGFVPSEGTSLDLDAVSTDSLRLLGSAIVFAAVLGLYLIWSAVFPALHILDEVTLWHTTAMADGEERRLPITLADLGLAAVYLGTAWVVARRLPALLDLILARRIKVASGSRYAITTLSTYAIVAIGTVLALNTIGAQWSQLQWLVAALGVGIGFGLQEIVANFISGLIILFERPVRVGDVVTVGDTDGVVTKIEIRATTIRNWDRKELIVPNKEFVTGRLLNWSLSDQITRVIITVGVAYGTNVEKAHALMREAAEEHERVLKDPQPILSFEGFGDNSLTLILRAFVDGLDYRLATITDLHKAIYRKFEQAGIVIAFPQRDLHLDTRERLRISIEETSRAEDEVEDTGTVGRRDSPSSGAGS